MKAVSGLLVVDKPAGPTSFDVVRRASRALGVRRAGHTGTLDPMATGVLVVCLGEATKLVPFLVAQDKRYRAVARLGVETDTLDRTGRTVRERVVPPLDDAAVEAALARLRGRIVQRPPVYSAVHVAGERAMERARRGETVEVPEREVEVHSLDVVSRTATEITLDVTCGKGTYVRSLVADLGESLGCGAHLADLCRERVGPFERARAVPLAEVEAHPDAAPILPPEDALVDLPSVVLSGDGVRRLRQGQSVSEEAFVAWDATAPEGAPLRCLDETGNLVGVGARKGNAVRALRVLAPGGV